LLSDENQHGFGEQNCLQGVLYHRIVFCQKGYWFWGEKSTDNLVAIDRVYFLKLRWRFQTIEIENDGKNA
jgi:hypothetical protein